MANALFDKGREKFLRGEISWNNDKIGVILVATGTGSDQYEVNLAVHEYLEDIPVAARVALLEANTVDPKELTGKTTTAGVADANDIKFEEVTGNEVGALVLYVHEDTDTETTSRLIAYIDTAIGIPVIPNGGDIHVEWDDGANKIFKL